MSKTLDQIPLNQKVSVLEIAEDELAPKLMEMGIYPGKTITTSLKAPLGDPIAIEIDNYTLSLRLCEAKLISVKNEN